MSATLPERTALGEPLVSADQLAAWLGKPRRTVYELVEQHGLPHYKIGRSLAFEVAAVRAWLDARRGGDWSDAT